jgi:hypothetical protein
MYVTKKARPDISLAIAFDDISVLTSKAQDKLLALLLQERQKSKSIVSSRVASGSESPVSGPTTDATLAGVRKSQ